MSPDQGASGGGKPPTTEPILPEEVCLDLATVAGLGDEPALLVTGNDRLHALTPAAAGLVADEALQEAFLAAAAQAQDESRVLPISLDGSESSGAEALEGVLMPLTDGGSLLVGRNMAAHHSLREALIESRRRYKDLVEVSSDFAWEVAVDEGFTFVSPGGALGYSASALMAISPEDLLLNHHGDDPSPFRAEHPLSQVEVWVRDAGDHHACLSFSVRPLYDDEGQWVGARGMARDITRDKERARALTRSHDRERLFNRILRAFRGQVEVDALMDTAAEHLALGLGADGCVVYANGSEGTRARSDSLQAVARFGATLSPEDEGLLRRSLADLGLQDAAMPVRLGPLRALGAPTVFSHRVNGAVALWREPARGAWTDQEAQLLAELADQIAVAHEQIAYHHRVLELSRTDPLTGLLNRRAFMEEVARRFRRVQGGDQRASLIYVDLDNFKATNDYLGHARGDEALQVVREVLRERSRPSDLVARLGGDEFALWLDGVDDTVVHEVTSRLVAAAEVLAPYSGTVDKPLTLSVGAAVLHPENGESLTQLLDRADGAMYVAKRGGKGRYAIAPAPDEEAGEVWGAADE